MSDVVIALTIEEALAVEVVLDYIYNDEGNCPDVTYEMSQAVTEATNQMMDEDNLWDELSLPNGSGELTLDEDEIDG